MKVYLAIVLDKKGERRKDLYITSSLQEMDEYMQKYQSSEDVRREYSDDIDAFLRNNKKYLEGLEADALARGENPRANYGRIHVCFYGKGGILRFVPAIYQGHRLKRRINMRNLQKTLMDDEVFKEVVKKYYLFGSSQYAKEGLSLYNRLGYDKYKKLLVELLIENIREARKEMKYYFFRALQDDCNLTEEVVIKTKYGRVKASTIPEEPVVLIKNNQFVELADDYMMQLANRGDYEQLFNLYSVDDIINYSPDPKNPVGITDVRRK